MANQQPQFLRPKIHGASFSLTSNRPSFSLTNNRPHMTVPSEGRIPKSLQNIFLASNRGQEVSVPPSDGIASKIFARPSFIGSFTLKKLWKTRSLRKNPALPMDPSSQKQHNAPLKKSKQQKLKTGATSPQDFLEKLLASRGYDAQQIWTRETGYCRQSSKLQLVSYHANLINLVHKLQLEKVAEILRSGVSPNPCNMYGESVLHVVCRTGNSQLLQVFLDAGASVQVSDDQGRTILHDACWRMPVDESSKDGFTMVRLLLDKDITLLHLKDVHGATPLSYVPKASWNAWKSFLWSVRDIYWPKQDLKKSQYSDLVKLPPFSCILPDPVNALSLSLATMVASGRVRPIEIEMIKEESREHDSFDSLSSSYDSEDSISSCSDFIDIDFDNQSVASQTSCKSLEFSTSTFDKQEMRDLLSSVAVL